MRVVIVWDQEYGGGWEPEEIIENIGRSMFEI